MMYTAVDAPALVARALILNYVRMARLRWRNIKAHDGDQDLSLEDMLCRTLVLMTKTEGLEQLFKKGIQKVKDTKNSSRTEPLLMQVAQKLLRTEPLQGLSFTHLKLLIRASSCQLIWCFGGSLFCASLLQRILQISWSCERFRVRSSAPSLRLS